jgi:hypothetical protein
VVVEIEVGRVDPVGPVQVQRRIHESLAQDRRSTDSAPDALPDLRKVGRTILRRGRLVERDASDVHRESAPLEVEEKIIHAADLAHHVTSNFFSY